jgi:hypothetical protein
MEARRRAEQIEDGEKLARGWCVGSERFRQELLEQVTTLAQSRFAGPEWRETTEKKAERILSEDATGNSATCFPGVTNPSSWTAAAIAILRPFAITSGARKVARARHQKSD